MSECIIKDCNKQRVAHGLCAMHYRRKKRGADMYAPPQRHPGQEGCDVTDCSGKHYSKGLCQLHYMRQKRSGHLGSVCRTAGCDKPIKARGFCSACYERMRLERSKLPRPGVDDILRDFTAEEAEHYLPILREAVARTPTFDLPMSEWLALTIAKEEEK